jgi:phosphatidylglycerophosphate synthase
MAGDVFNEGRRGHELVLAGHQNYGLDFGCHQPIGVGKVEFELEIAELSEAPNDGNRLVFLGEFNRQAGEGFDTNILHALAGLACHGEALIKGEPRIFGITGGDGEDDAVEQVARPAQDVEVSQGDGVEGAGVDGDAELACHCFPVAAETRTLTLSSQAPMRFLRQIPNLLTAARLPAVFLIGIWTYWAGVWASAALALFIVAALTDIFDGWIARKLGAVSDFGRLMDALVDKIFILGLLVALAATDCLPVRQWDDLGEYKAIDPQLTLIAAFGVILILMREFLITGLRLVAAAKGQVLEAEGLGKIKTFAQIIAIGHLIGLRAYETHWKLSAVWHQRWEVIIMTLFWLSVALTVVSGTSYLIRHRRHLPGLSE